jgi:predicted nucleic acid-binding protein
MNIYLDTSAVIKLYYREVGSEELLAFLRRYADHLILTMADLTRIEFHSAFLRRVRTGEFPLEAVQRVFAAFDRDARMFHVIEVDRAIKSWATQLLDRLAAQRGLRTLDALQLAAALFAHHVLPIDYFVSADTQFLNIAADFFAVFNPEP